MANNKAILQLKNFEVDEKRQQVTLIESMISDFERMIKELDTQIEQEHKKTGITDISHFAYSTFAKAALQRKQNLVKSIDGLKSQMVTTQKALEDAIADFKKFELRDKLNTSRERTRRLRDEQSALDDVAGQRAYRR